MYRYIILLSPCIDQIDKKWKSMKGNKSQTAEGEKLEKLRKVGLMWWKYNR